MAKKSDKPQKSNPNPTPVDPETQQKQSLRSLAISKRILRRSPANPSAALAPSKSVLKLEGRDVLKRGQRKSRFLFSFPGLLAPVAGGRVGELADLSTKNPVLYLVFTNIVFPEAWWIGTKEENPEEHQLEFPKDINENKQADPDFKGGAGATYDEAASLKKPTKEYKEKSLPLDTESVDDEDADSYPSTGEYAKILPVSTPVRQSAGMAGKTSNYVESSGNDSIASDADEPKTEEPEREDEDDVRTDNGNASRRSILAELEDSMPATSSLLVDEKKIEQSSSPKKLKKAKENPPSKKGSLVQATLSSLFGKAAEKVLELSDNGLIQIKSKCNCRSKDLTRKKSLLAERRVGPELCQ